MAVKLKDGLFLGNEAAAEDFEFVLANKVGRIVNCAGRQVANSFSNLGLSYLTFNWVDNDSQTILDLHDETVAEAVGFIDEGLNRGESVLVHSQRGQSRSATLLTGYLMVKYFWSLNKALEYMQSRKEDVAVKPAFHRQLLALERRLVSAGHSLSSDWTTPPPLSGDHAVLHNTFVNSRRRAQFEGENKKMFRDEPPPPSRSSKHIVWRDEHLQGLERGSDASGQVHFGRSYRLKSALKLVQAAASPLSTAASTPQITSAPLRVLRPATPVRDSPLFRPTLLGSYSRQPSPMPRTGTSFLQDAKGSLYSSTSLHPSPMRTPVVSPTITAINGIYSPGYAKPVRTGRTLFDTNVFPLRTPQVHHYARPPSPVVHHRPQNPIRPPSPQSRPVLSSVRAPSPARSDRPVLSFNKQEPPPMQITLDVKPRSLMASQLRRAQSPVVTSLLGDRPNSAPQWRLR